MSSGLSKNSLQCENVIQWFIYAVIHNGYFVLVQVFLLNPPVSEEMHIVY